MGIAPSTSSPLKALDLMLQRQAQQDTENKRQGLALLNMKLREDESEKHRLFQQSNQIRSDLLKAVDDFGNSAKAYNAIGGVTKELFKGDSPTKDAQKFLGALTTVAGSDAKHAEDTFKNSFGLLGSIQAAQHKLDNEIGRTKEFVLKTGAETWDAARLGDVTDKGLRAQRIKGTSSAYNKAFASEAEMQSEFANITKSIQDKTKNKNFKLTSAMKTGLSNYYTERSKWIYNDLSRQETAAANRSLSQRGAKPDFSYMIDGFKADVGYLNSMNTAYGLDEMPNIPTVGASTQNVAGHLRSIENNMTKVVEKEGLDPFFNDITGETEDIAKKWGEVKSQDEKELLAMQLVKSLGLKDKKGKLITDLSDMGAEDKLVEYLMHSVTAHRRGKELQLHLETQYNPTGVFGDGINKLVNNGYTQDGSGTPPPKEQPKTTSSTSKDDSPSLLESTGNNIGSFFTGKVSKKEEAVIKKRRREDLKRRIGSIKDVAFDLLEGF